MSPSRLQAICVLHANSSESMHNSSPHVKVLLVDAHTESQPPPLLKVPATAERLNISTRTLYALVERNEVPHVRIGGQIRFMPSALEQWLRDGGKRAP